MKRLMIIAIAICICGGLVISAPVSEAKKMPYVIGIALDLTGRAASLGIPEKRVYDRGLLLKTRLELPLLLVADVPYC